MKRMQAELSLAKLTVFKALEVLSDLKPEESYFDSEGNVPREMKSAADVILENVILDNLKDTGLSILSEEIGLIEGIHQKGLHWVVDPLDGTVNFMRRLSPCAVSIALCDGDKPLLGVVGEFPSKRISWGCYGMGAFSSDVPIHVSSIVDKKNAVICSGFPSRFEFTNENMDWIMATLQPFAKVRMLGSASLSLTHVAMGSAEAYSERNIMFWDVAAGLAILEAAGGYYIASRGLCDYALNIFASNGLIEGP
jgi:myo-inositol-1(or 4)-monophosphatase